MPRSLSLKTKSLQSQAKEIRDFYAEGLVTQSELAKEFKLSPTTIRKILVGELFPEEGGKILDPVKRNRLSSQRKVTDEEAVVIRELIAAGKETYQSLATRYGTTKDVIQNIYLQRTKKKIGGKPPIKFQSKRKIPIQMIPKVVALSKTKDNDQIVQIFKDKYSITISTNSVYRLLKRIEDDNRSNEHS